MKSKIGFMIANVVFIAQLCCGYQTPRPPNPIPDTLCPEAKEHVVELESKVVEPDKTQCKKLTSIESVCKNSYAYGLIFPVDCVIKSTSCAQALKCSN
jgi:hypothetical protein